MLLVPVFNSLLVVSISLKILDEGQNSRGKPFIPNQIFLS